MADEIKMSPPNVEQPRSPEAPKQSSEYRERQTVPVERPKETTGQQPSLPKSFAQQKKTAPVQQKSELRLDIEDILEEDLQDIYFKMTPKQRLQFKTEGEKTAGAIEQLMKKAQVKLIEVISIIKQWLLLIPGVSKFFIEQEAKIKADRIYDLNKKEDIHY